LLVLARDSGEFDNCNVAKPRDVGYSGEGGIQAQHVATPNAQTYKVAQF
jgi:hypothetical protein